MIHGTKETGLLLVGLLLLLNTIGWAQYTPTNEIVSNDIFQIVGNGDTLWMISSKGVNYHTDISNSMQKWQGFNNLKGWFLAYGNGYTIIRLKTNDFSYYNSGTPDQIWLFSVGPPESQALIKLPFQTDLINDTLIFQAADAIWFQGAFWLACMNGGLVKLNASDHSQTIFFPGEDTTSYDYNTFITQKDSIFPDSAFLLDITADDEHIWVSSIKDLWQFNPVDTTWQHMNDTLHLQDSVLLVSRYLDIAARTRNDTAILFTTFISHTNDTCLAKYNRTTGLWQLMQNNSGISLVTFGKDNYVYMLNLNENSVSLFLDTGTNFNPPLLDKFTFENRINNANKELELVSFARTDLHYAIHGTDTIFAIATEKGLFYSTNAHYDENHNIPFTYVNRSVALPSGLKEIYAVPGIINDVHRETVFAYNLAEDSFISIDIFDYNMDHVVRIIDHKLRLAGKNKTSGRSTIPSQDRWDGTKKGKPVAPGVYYFRIKTNKGDRAFGKVIVARN